MRQRENKCIKLVIEIDVGLLCSYPWGSKVTKQVYGQFEVFVNCHIPANFIVLGNRCWRPWLPRLRCCGRDVSPGISGDFCPNLNGSELSPVEKEWSLMKEPMVGANHC